MAKESKGKLAKYEKFFPEIIEEIENEYESNGNSLKSAKFEDENEISPKEFLDDYKKCENKINKPEDIDKNTKACIGTKAWYDFTQQIRFGIFCNDHPLFRMTCSLITVLLMIGFFYISFGLPFLDIPMVRIYCEDEDDTKIHRNGVRVMSGGVTIDSPYRTIDVADYINDVDLQSKFKKMYIKLREKGRNAKNASEISFRKIDPRIDMEFNYTLVSKNVEGNISDSFEIKSGDFFNDFLSTESTKRSITSMTITQQKTRRTAK